MNDGAIISVEGLSKRYRLGVIGATTLRESVERAWHRLRGRDPGVEMGKVILQPTAYCPQPSSLWALRDVSFTVERGEVVGIIGRNGAGKSTLLKILTRITEPTSGRAVMRGRVASLLEVGTGFHPELTGRENVFLNGAILGMKKVEIQRKFDDIVAFAEVEQFIDTPVKRYSSGMYVRLAFAVAAHLEPEILLVDEVLAVGDIGFQKRCLGKMGEVARGGRTILFVSHNMGAVRELCPRSIWLDVGRIAGVGATPEVVDAYLRSCDKSGGSGQCVFAEDPLKDFQLRSVCLKNVGGEKRQRFECDEPVTIEFECQVRRRVPGLYGYLQIARNDGTTVMISDSLDTTPNPLDGLGEGRHTARIHIPCRSLGPGTYSVYLNFTSASGNAGFDVDSPGTVAGFTLEDSASRRGNSRGGFFSTLLKWKAD